jgi:rod shape-determining protein MreC
MKHYFSARVRTVMIIAVALAVVLAVVGSMTGFSLGSTVVQGVLAPIRSGVSQLTDQAEQLYSYMFRYEAIAAENNALKQQIAQMQDDARQADAIARENDRLRELLDFKQNREDFVPVDAYVIGRSSVDWENTLTVNRGTNDGLAVGMCAITETGGLVGLVSEVGTNYAVIKTVLDSSLEISATISGTGTSGYSGMVRGGYSTDNAGKLRMSYLPTDATIHNFDQAVTTGSTVYPRGLIVGHVVNVGFDDTGVAKYALLEPAVDMANLEQVFIVTDYSAG